ncbi:PIN domain-containing protein [Pseudaminobacter arsenicus]|uniref:Ribonuclease VapC n=1 Tax=Borborobacter arsenicus TaxID=1851146 RepID=A0A432V8H9_9HYPH|nr:PIN domain-containing protein [Pseudaminobacter arsenicus]RUM98450.1 PIN domain-containing protein [Pseudaminobacter arsenicus]
MSAPDEFLDTNVLIYAFTTDPRAVTAEKLLAKGCVISVQCLNEFANVARRKLGMSWEETHDALGAIRSLAKTILPVDLDTHSRALRLAERYALSFFDALMLAAALQGGCATFWSEDMQHGTAIEERLRIVNPFA